MHFLLLLKLCLSEDPLVQCQTQNRGSLPRHHPPVRRAMGLFLADSVCDVLFDFPVAIMKYSNKQLKGERAYMAFNYRFHQTGKSQHQSHMISIVKSRKLEINVCMLVLPPSLVLYTP